MKNWKPIYFLAFILITFSACKANDQAAYSTEEVIQETRTATETALPAIEPTDSGPDLDQITTNLKSFIRLYGIVRYYHPSDTVEDADWNAFAVNGIKFVQCASDTEDLIFRLNTVFHVVAPTAEVFDSKDSPTIHPALTLQTDTEELSVIRWEHQGLAGLGSTSLFTSKRTVESILDGIIPPDYAAPQDGFQTEISDGINLFVPTSLFVSGEFTLPASETTAPVHLSSSCLSEKITNHLADITVSWNVLQHSYPYFDLADSNWMDVLDQTILETINTEDEEEFQMILRKMLAQLEDGQADVTNPAIHDVFIPRVELAWVEDQIVVLSVNTSDLEGVEPGDIVVGIGTQPIEELLNSLPDSISGATDQWIKNQFLTELMRGKLNTSILLKIDTQSNGVRSYLAERNLLYSEADHASAPKLTEIEPGILYLDLSRITEDEFNTAISEMEAAAGIILDLRGTPLLPVSVLGHFIDEPILSQQYLLPETSLPDQIEVNWINRSFQVEPVEPRLNPDLVFLADGSSIAYAETFLNLVSTYQLGEIIGSQTAGTNGYMNLIITPGGYEITWTGVKTLNQDGSQFQGTGIQPTIYVTRTIDGIREGRDELIDAAIEILEAAP